MLVVDDDIAMGSFLTAQMIRRGFEVSSASGGEEAVRVFRVCDPALVLLDLSGPARALSTLLERIKQIKPDVSVVMLSSRHDPEMIFTRLQAGRGRLPGQAI